MPSLLLNVTKSVRLNTDFLVSKFGNCEYLMCHSNENAIRIPKNIQKVILDLTKSEQATEVRTVFESQNHVEAIPRYFYGNNIGE